MKHKLFATTPEGDTLPGNYGVGSGCFVTKKERPTTIGLSGMRRREPSYFKKGSERVFYEGYPEYFTAKKRFKERLRLEL